jgi:hypothetical protein
VLTAGRELRLESKLSVLMRYIKLEQEYNGIASGRSIGALTTGRELRPEVIGIDEIYKISAPIQYNKIASGH